MIAGHAEGAGLAPTAWLPSLGVATALAGAYLTAVRHLPPPVPGGPRRWPPRRSWCFLAGVAAIAIGISPPVEAAGSDPRGHMAQHLLLGMYAPLLVVFGAPGTLALSSLPLATRRRAHGWLRQWWIRFPTRLPVAFTLHLGGMLALYLTPLYALTARSQVAHLLVHAHMVVAGVLFLWVVVGSDPVPRRPSLAWRLGAAILAAAIHNVLSTSLFAHAPHLPPGATGSIEAWHTAAQLMYYGGHLAEVVILVALCSEWFDRRRDRLSGVAGGGVRERRAAPIPLLRATR